MGRYQAKIGIQRAKADLLEIPGETYLQQTPKTLIPIP